MIRRHGQRGHRAGFIPLSRGFWARFRQSIRRCNQNPARILAFRVIGPRETLREFHVSRIGSGLDDSAAQDHATRLSAWATRRGFAPSGPGAFSRRAILASPRPCSFLNVSGCSPVVRRNLVQLQTCRGVPNGVGGSTNDRIRTSRRSSTSGMNDVQQNASSMALISCGDGMRRRTLISPSIRGQKRRNPVGKQPAHGSASKPRPASASRCSTSASVTLPL